jgi:hypothetical protein
MARQQKPLPPPKRCVYCGALATSRDHVIPSSLFTPPLPQMITVPACAECQREKSYGDDDLAHYVAFSWAGSQHPRAREQLERAKRATLIGRSKLGKAVSKGGSTRELLTDSGIYLFDVWEVPIPDENRDMFKTLEYIVRGLHVVRRFRFDRTIAPIPPDCPVDVRGLNRLKAEPTITRFLGLPHEDFVVMRNSPATNEQPIAMWSRTIPVGGDPFSRYWLLVFNDQECFVGATGEVAIFGRKYMNERQVKP